MSQLTKEQIEKLVNNPMIKATVEANKARAKATRQADLMLLGYNQALLDNNLWLEGHTRESWAEVVAQQKSKLEIK